MLKVMRGKLTFIVPKYWLDGYGFLRPKAVCALKVFFKVKTNEQADKELEIRENSTRVGWYRFNVPKGDNMNEV